MVCKTLLLFKHHPSYNSGSCVFLKGPPLLLELGSPYPICCASPTNAEVVLACYILRSQVFIRVEKTKLPPHGLLFILFSIFNSFQKMLPEFGICYWGCSSNVSGFALVQGRRVQDVAIRLTKGFKYGWMD